MTSVGKIGVRSVSPIDDSLGLDLRIDGCGKYVTPDDSGADIIGLNDFPLKNYRGKAQQFARRLTAAINSRGEYDAAGFAVFVIEKARVKRLSDGGAPAYEAYRRVEIIGDSRWGNRSPVSSATANCSALSSARAMFAGAFSHLSPSAT